jgi:hypothetical protein
MKIKPPGSGIPPLPPAKGPEPAPESAKPRPAGEFKTAQTGTPASAATGLPGVAGQFKKADLRDAGKVDQILRSAIQEMTATDFSAAKLSAADQKYLVDWMQNDPTMRSRLLNYLERVLE